MKQSAPPLLVLAIGLIFLMALLPSKPPTPSIEIPIKTEVEPYRVPKGYVCFRADKPITIDGKLDEATWNLAPWSDPFEDIEGDKRPKPRFPTRMKMLWDDQNLYIAAHLEEPHVWGTLKEHDSVIFKDNDFEVFIDPDGDNHLYGELELNALNTTWDLLLSKPYKDGGRAIDSWEIKGLKTAVHVDGTLNDPKDTDRGWSLEIAWPWKSLVELTHFKRPPEHGDQWRINFSRVEWLHEVVNGKYEKVKGKPEDNWVWSPQGVIDMHRPEHWGYLQFSTKTPEMSPFVPDPTSRARHELHQIYYAQLQYRKRQRVWANTLPALGLDQVPGFSKENIQLLTTPTTYEATWSGYTPDGNRTRLRIYSDSRIVRE